MIPIAPLLAAIAATSALDTPRTDVTTTYNTGSRLFCVIPAGRDDGDRTLDSPKTLPQRRRVALPCHRFKGPVVVPDVMPR